MNIYITGGHLTPALAVIGVLQKRREKPSIFFVGREYAQTLTKHPSHEQHEVEALGIPFFPIQAAKFHREQFWLNLFEIGKFPISFFQVLSLFRAHRPDAVLSFGGYVALPVCIVAKLFGARVITHEQTKVAGLANQVIAKVADVVAVTSEASLPFFPKEKTVVTGNPIRESLLREYKVPPPWFPKAAADYPFLYVTGGSQGSQIINHVIATLLPKLTRTFVIIHQCGASAGSAVLHDLEKVKDTLPEDQKDRYVVREWIEAKEVSYLMRQAKFVIGRAGANTVEELTLAGTPAIFIPLAFAYNNEQEKNARLMVENGAALLVLQKELYPETLSQAIQSMNRRYDTIWAKAQKLKDQTVKNGARLVADLLFP